MKYLVSVLCFLIVMGVVPITSKADTKVVVIPLLKNKKITGDATPADVVEGKTFTTADGEHTGIRPPAPIGTDYVNNAGTITGSGVKPPDPRFVPFKFQGVEQRGYGIHDLMTGLIWNKSPSSTETTWGNANNACENLVTTYSCYTIGGSMVVPVSNWRLPTIKEIISLLDYGRGVSDTFNALVQPNYFSNISRGIYWTNTISMVPCSPVGTRCNIVHVVDIDHATVSKQLIHPDVAPPEHFYWCVRGPYGLEY